MAHFMLLILQPCEQFAPNFYSRNLLTKLKYELFSVLSQSFCFEHVLFLLAPSVIYCTQKKV